MASIVAVRQQWVGAERVWNVNEGRENGFAGTVRNALAQRREAVFFF
jgi:hypothetical protein